MTVGIPFRTIATPTVAATTEVGAATTGAPPAGARPTAAGTTAEANIACSTALRTTQGSTALALVSAIPNTSTASAVYAACRAHTGSSTLKATPDRSAYRVANDDGPSRPITASTVRITS